MTLISLVISIAIITYLCVSGFFDTKVLPGSEVFFISSGHNADSPTGSKAVESVDVLLVGAGAMSTTLRMLLQQLDPSLRICMVEKLDRVAKESTDALNNAGTGHAGNCELNYTPQNDDGSIDTKKAFKINADFEVSLQFWSHLVEKGLLGEPSTFINQVPHLSFVFGKDDVDFLRKRYELLKDSVAFGDMEFSDDHKKLKEWVPLIMKDRPASDVVAATRVRYGTDVNFGDLARGMARHLEQQDHFDLRLSRVVTNLRRNKDCSWLVDVYDTRQGKREFINAKFVFLGAGGGALPLLQKSGIPEGRGYGGFPVGGQWLICDNPKIVDQHLAKVYGNAEIGAPPMSVPHLDTRTIDGKRKLLFGPFAGFSTKYLKNGSYLDLFTSFRPDNLVPMIAAGMDNVPLTIYLIKEVLKDRKGRCQALHRFYKEAKPEDWELAIAGQRVQIIKKGEKKLGKLQFGTEVVSASDGSLSALLGASPGASTAVAVMLRVIEDCFPEEVKSEAWQKKLKEMIPSYGEDLNQNDELFRKIRKHNNEVLNIDNLP